MDIFSHGLWAGVAYKAVNKRGGRSLSVKLAAFWGMFPDLFAFTAGFVWLFWNLAFWDLSFVSLPHLGGSEAAIEETLPIFRLTSLLYSISHSAIVFLVIFGVAFLVFRRPIWELGGWLIHILIDIPTHSYQFYPTPFLWPLSDWKFDGFSWGTPWFLILNYSAILIVYLLLRKKKRSETSNS